MKISKFEFRSPKFACALIVLAALAAYHNSFSGPFIFDDHASITDNTTIRSLWPPGPVFSPPPKAGSGGRPVLNLSLAINYAFGSTSVWGYHAVNLLIHILAGLTLFGIVRRTLERLARLGAAGFSQAAFIAERDSGAAVFARRRGGEDWWSELPPTRSFDGANQRVGGNPLHPDTTLAFAIALLWTVHPLQTEAVTYLSERAESLMGLFYLLTLYFFIRSVDSLEVGRRAPATPSVGNSGGAEGVAGARRTTCFVFAGLSFLACLLGMATKEVMVTAPVIVFLYDRTFVSGTFREAWRRHWRYYLGLAATWLLLRHVVANAREQGVGLGVGGSWWDYALTECRVVVRYLLLAIWPHPLVFDYGSGVAQPTWALLPDVMVVMALVAGTVWALFSKFRNSNFGIRNLGFAGAWIFIILAPTSSVIAVAGQPMAEHRMYLPLAAVIAAVVLGGCALINRLKISHFAFRISIFLLAIVCIGLTARRNETYRSDLAIWGDTAAKRPANERAQIWLGLALVDAGRLSEAIGYYRKALLLNGEYVAEAHHNLAAALKKAGRISEAVIECEEALRLRPEDPEYHYNLGVALQADGRIPEAAAQFDQALRLKPDYPDAQYNLGAALAGEGNLPGAIDHYQAALRLKPDYADAHYDLANALAQVGRGAEAMAQSEEVLRINPDDAPAHNNLGIALAGAGRVPEAISHLRAATRLAPGRADYHYNLGVVLLRQDQAPEAGSEFERALELKPDYDAARDILERVKMLEKTEPGQ